MLAGLFLLKSLERNLSLAFSNFQNFLFILTTSLIASLLNPMDSRRAESFCLGDSRCISFISLPDKQSCLSPDVPGLSQSIWLPLFWGDGYCVYKVLEISTVPLTPLFVFQNSIFQCSCLCNLLPFPHREKYGVRD